MNCPMCKQEALDGICMTCGLTHSSAMLEFLADAEKEGALTKRQCDNFRDSYKLNETAGWIPIFGGMI